MNAIDALRRALAATFGFYFLTHSFHWNVEGPLFPELHALFGSLYDDAFGAVDRLAEELRALDEYAPRSLGEIGIGAPTAAAIDALDMIRQTDEANAGVLVALNEASAAAMTAGKAGLANFLQERIDVHSKHAWMLRATLKG